MYRTVDALLVRAATHPADAALPAWPDITATPADLAAWAGWLRQVWSRESFADAITAASPVLARQVRRACDGRCDDPRRMRRTVLSVARYLLRMTGRSTPFGLFAGVAAARFSPQPRMRWGEQHRVVVRADAAWLAPVITRLEACPQLLCRLPVVVNTLSVVRGDRLVLPFQDHAAPSSGRAAGDTTLTEVSVRRTRAVDAAVRQAGEPVEFRALLAALAAQFPGTSTTVIEAMLAELVRLRVLLTGLRPPMTATDGLAFVVAQLRAVGADGVPDVADELRALTGINDDLARHHRGGTAAGERPGHRAPLADQMRRVNDTVERPITVDLHLDLDVTLPERVAREAEATAAALTRLTPHPDGLAAWQEFHTMFLERYGVRALVPLLELVDPDTGLGFPATYRGSDRTAPAAPLSDRDRQLLTWVQKATMAGRDEIVVDDQMISALGGDTVHQPPPHVELFVQIHAASQGAMQRGDFTVVVTGAARSAGATTGRFLHLLDDPDRDRFRGVYAAVSTSRAGAVPVQVSGPPLRVRTQNVAVAPAVLHQVVCVGDYPTPGVDRLPLSDLAVGGDADGLYLVSLSQQRLIEPTALNAVEFRHMSQPLTRFLCEVTRARAAVYMPFSWGAASSLPVLPRIRYGRTVLAPARWNLAGSDLPARKATWPHWQRCLEAWRRQFRLPARVYLVEADNLLSLDLDQDLHLALLRSHIDRQGHARLDEAPPANAYGWIGGHAHEIAVPLTATATGRPAATHTSGVRPVSRDDEHLPGASPWLYAKLYCQPGRHTDILIRLAHLMSTWDTAVGWWYVPYRDPDPHLRVRVRLPTRDDYGPATRRLGAWATQLHRHGLLSRMQLDTYAPETGRFGFGDAMAAAERVFAADSAAALSQRQQAARGGAGADAVTAASLVEVTIGFTGQPLVGMRWLVDRLLHEPAPVDHALQATAARLADPRDDWAALRADGGDAVVGRWQRRRAALADYRQVLAVQRDPLSVLPSLLHLHHIRMFGLDPDRERLGRRLARAAAQRWIATTAGPTL